MKIKTPKPRGRPKLLDRQQALLTALHLFWQHGYEGTSIAELTEAMGVTPPSLYAAFGSKEQLYHAALELYATTFGGFMQQALAEEPDVWQAMARILHDAVELYTTPSLPGGCMLASTTIACAPEHAKVMAEVTTRRLSAIAQLQQRFDKAVADGEIATTTDTASLAAYYAAVIQGISLQARDGVAKTTLQEVAKVALLLWPQLTGTK